MAGKDVERRLAAILAADVAGYSRMMEADEADTLARLKSHLGEIVRPTIANHRGNVVKTTGDGLLAEFASVVAAVECAVEIQRGMMERSATEADGRQIRFRIGINLGDIIIDDGDIFGDGVNIAARLEGLADPGGICVHRDVKSQVQHRLPIVFEDMGEVEVKNIARPLRIYRVKLDGAGIVARTTRPSTTRRTRRGVYAVSAVVVLLAAIALLWYQWPLGTTAETITQSAPALPDNKRSIAVLPFANMSNDPEQQYFADGLTEDLTTRLSGLSGLFVIARSSVLGYQGKVVKPQDVAHDLGVRYLLDGSVRKSGARVRINANLVEAATARQIWAEQYDRDLTDIFTLQDEVIGHIVSGLEVELTDLEQKHIARVPTENLEAYDYYLRAETEGYYRPTIGRALEYYSKAIDLDPKFADAHAGYARVAVEVFRFDEDQVMPAPLARKQAYDAAGKALELDPNNSRAFTVLAILQQSDGRSEDAIKSATRAVSLSPNDAEARANLGLILSYAGRHEEAVTAVEEAKRLNPITPAGLRLLAGTVFFDARQYERAIAELEPVVAEWPSAETPREYLIAAYALHGEVDRAKTEVPKLPTIGQINLTEFRIVYGGSYALQADFDHLLDGLARGGVPQWPFGFVGRAEDRLTGSDLQVLVSNKTWTGESPIGPGKSAPFVLQIDAKNRVAYRSTSTFLTGESRLENERICMRFAGYQKNQWICGDVFRNNATNPGPVVSNKAFVYILPDGLRYFSVKS
jgi:adenylate cyclase